jgi:choline dehydrogenase-like flavoprotein
MVWIRGHPQDYEDWRAAGNPGWGWDEARAAFRAIEDNEDGPCDLRGAGGPLFIRSNRMPGHALVEPFLAACESLGLKRNADFNGADQEGRRHLPADHPRRAAQLGRARLPAPGAQAAERGAAQRRAGHAHALRRPPRQRRSNTAGRAARCARGRAR